MASSTNLTLGLSMDTNPFAYGLSNIPVLSIYDEILNIIFKNRNIHVFGIGSFNKFMGNFTFDTLSTGGGTGGTKTEEKKHEDDEKMALYNKKEIKKSDVFFYPNEAEDGDSKYKLDTSFLMDKSQYSGGKLKFNCIIEIKKTLFKQIAADIIKDLQKKFNTQDSTAELVRKLEEDHFSTLLEKLYSNDLTKSKNEFLTTLDNQISNDRISDEYKDWLNSIKNIFKRLKRGQYKIGHNDLALIDDNSFIKWVAKGYIPDPYTLDDHRDKFKLEKTQSIRAFLCAKCVYLSYLSREYVKKLESIIEKIDEERIKFENKIESYMNAGVDVDRSTPLYMKNLIEKKALIETLVSQANERFKEIVDISTSKCKKPSDLWTYLNYTEKDPSEPSVSFGKRQSYSYSMNDKRPNAALSVMSENYKAIVMGEWKEKLQFTDYSRDHTKYSLLKGAEELINGGVNVEIRNKFYRMACSFALSPVTMFRSMVLNIALMGPPGTGKSTLAKKIGGFAYAVGWLMFNPADGSGLVEPKPSDLISDKTGQTALKTRSYLNSSIGKMCFIDEAYALTPTPITSAGKEFSDELTEFLTNHKGWLLMMVAGYVDEMQHDFFASNIGLPRRFPTRIVLGVKTPFECFTAFMFQITSKLLGDKGKKGMGALNFSAIAGGQIPFFIRMATIWLPIFHILLGKDAPKDPNHREQRFNPNLLKNYYSDVDVIAEIFFRYLVLTGLFHNNTPTPNFGAGAFQSGSGINWSSILERTLNAWLNTRTSENNRISTIILNPAISIPKNDLVGLTQYERLFGIYDTQDPDFPKATVENAFSLGKELLQKNICIWPAIAGDKPVYYAYYSGIKVSFKKVDPDKEGYIADTGYEWINTKEGINASLKTDTTQESRFVHDYTKEVQRKKKELENKIKTNQYQIKSLTKDHKVIEELLKKAAKTTTDEKKIAELEQKLQESKDELKKILKVDPLKAKTQQQLIDNIKKCKKEISNASLHGRTIGASNERKRIEAQLKRNKAQLLKKERNEAQLRQYVVGEMFKQLDWGGPHGKLGKNDKKISAAEMRSWIDESQENRDKFENFLKTMGMENKIKPKSKTNRLRQPTMEVLFGSGPPDLPDRKYLPVWEYEELFRDLDSDKNDLYITMEEFQKFFRKNMKAAGSKGLRTPTPGLSKKSTLHF